MNQKPKIFVFKLREIVYTLVLMFLAILLVVCLVLMFTGKSKENRASVQTDRSEDTGSTAETASVYTPGIYTSTVTLGNSAADIEVTVDKDHINAIRLVNLSESAAASYPLVTPSFDHIAEQILTTQSLEGITCPQENKYTSQILLSAIAETLEKAQQ